MEKLKIMILDDEQRVREEIGEFLLENGFQVFKAELPSQAFKILEQNEIDITILDIKLPEMDGIQVLEKIKTSYPEIEVIMISGHGDMNSVISAMRLGASDYFTKPFRLMDVHNSIERTKRFITLNSKLKEVEHNLSLVSNELQDKTGHSIITQSPKMKSIIELISKVAKTEDTSVLITGESGTGKELVARGIHYLSSRKEKYFYDVNCSAVPENLFESEFFGHKKGAFTGATESKAGWFEVASKGTLFLDEIGDMPLNLQSKFLRVLEERKIRRVGSHIDIPVDVRVIAATNRRLEDLIEEKLFRVDLFHRLNSFSIHIPPLRERSEDIPLLINHFASEFSKKMKKPIQEIDENVLNELSNYNFPGNVRELKNMVERAVILNDRGKLHLKHFPILAKVSDQPVFSEGAEIIFDLELAEKNLIMKALEKCKNNKAKAAKLLNITWQSLDRRMKKFGIL